MPFDPVARRRTRIKLLAILAVCAAPVIASYTTYYLIKPDGRTNYGELVTPPRPAAALAVTGSDGAAGTMERFLGKWVLVTLASDGCDPVCAQRLYVMRQVRLTTGKDRDRIERAIIFTDGTTPARALLSEHEGLRVLRVDAAAVSAVLAPLPVGEPALYVIDPLGNVMMRFPGDADPSRMKKDIAKLLRASRVG